ncbi:MAG TPA: hypothetical protein VIM63_00775, partial [Rhodoferax sp.]
AGTAQKRVATKDTHPCRRPPFHENLTQSGSGFTARSSEPAECLLISRRGHFYRAPRFLDRSSKNRRGNVLKMKNAAAFGFIFLEMLAQ